MDRKSRLHNLDEGMAGIYFHEERDLDLADRRREANEKIRDMVQKGIIKTLGKKWIEMVEQNSFVKIGESINRYAQLVNKLVKLDNDRQLVFQDELDCFSGIINRCYENTDGYFDEVSKILSEGFQKKWASIFGTTEIHPIGSRNEANRPKLITKSKKRIGFPEIDEPNV